jgi:hypothetical protein
VPSYLVRLLAALFLLAVPASAGTLYIPVLGPDTPEDASFQTRVWLTNGGSEAATVTAVRMRGVVDGTRERGKETRYRIAPGATRVLTTGAIEGLLEIRAPERVAVAAELRNLSLPGPGEVFGAVPVISSDTLAEGGAELLLQGIRRSTQGVATHLGLVNLGAVEAVCDLEVRGAGGGVLGQAEGVRLPPLSHARVPDVLEMAGVDQAGDAHAVVSCSERFYAYLASVEAATGETAFMTPSATGASTLKPPGASGSQAGGKSYAFVRSGLVHSPSRKRPTWTHNLRVPPNTDFSRVELEMDVTPGDWYRAEPEKMHNLFWIHRGGCCWPRYNANIIGYANAFGPGRGGNRVKVTHNLGRHRRPFPRIQEGFQLRKGTTYRLRYVYDASRGEISLKLFSRGELRFESTDRATVDSIRSDGSGEFMLYLGHTPHAKGSGSGPERPTYGWKYSNLRVELFP